MPPPSFSSAALAKLVPLKKNASKGQNRDLYDILKPLQKSGINITPEDLKQLNLNKHYTDKLLGKQPKHLGQAAVAEVATQQQFKRTPKFTPEQETFFNQLQQLLGPALQQQIQQGVGPQFQPAQAPGALKALEALGPLLAQQKQFQYTPSPGQSPADVMQRLDFAPIANEARSEFYGKAIPSLTERLQPGSSAARYLPQELRGKFESQLAAEAARYGLQREQAGQRAQQLEQAGAGLNLQGQSQYQNLLSNLFGTGGQLGLGYGQLGLGGAQLGQQGQFRQQQFLQGLVGPTLQPRSEIAYQKPPDYLGAALQATGGLGQLIAQSLGAYYGV